MFETSKICLITCAVHDDGTASPFLFSNIIMLPITNSNVYLDIQEKNVYTLSQTIKYTFALEMDSAHESKFTGICCSG